MLVGAEGPTALPASGVGVLWLVLSETGAGRRVAVLGSSVPIFFPEVRCSTVARSKLACDGWGLLDSTLDPGVVAGWYSSIQQSPGAWLLQGSGSEGGRLDGCPFAAFDQCLCGKHL